MSCSGADSGHCCTALARAITFTPKSYRRFLLSLLLHGEAEDGLSETWRVYARHVVRKKQRGRAAAKALGDHATEANTERYLRDREIAVVDGPAMVQRGLNS